MKSVLQMLDEETHVPEIWVTKFDEEHAQKFRKQVMEVSKSDPQRPVLIYIDSYGGYVDALSKMIETLDEIPNPVVTICMGKAMSCGAILLSHGDIRFLGRNSRIMIHEVSSGTFGNVQDMKEDTKETVRINEQFMGLLAKNCGFKHYEEFRGVIKEQDGRDRYLVGNDALKFGIVDVIGLPKVTGRVVYEISKQPTKALPTQRNTQTLRSNVAAKPKKKVKKSDSMKRKKGV
jgi:ATP-dependent Clp protease protease subunit